MDTLNDKQIVLYHGGNQELPNTLFECRKYMHEEAGNCQEGIGIYFSTDLSVADSYGSKISKLIIDNSKLLPSRAFVEDVISDEKLVNFIIYLNSYSDTFFDIFNNYALGEFENGNEIDDFHAQALVNIMKTEEVRNVQIELLEAFEDIDYFISGWVQHIDSYGTFNEELNFYAILYSTNDIESLMIDSSIYLGSCVELKARDLEPMIQNAKEIDINEFTKYVSTFFADEVVFGDNPSEFSVTNDYHVNFFTSVFQNQEVVYVEHSAVEYIFIKKERVC